jgi:hypothetical protein
MVADLAIFAPSSSKPNIRPQVREKALRRPASHAESSAGIILCSALLLFTLDLRVSADAQELRRATLWDLKLGEPISAQPAPEEFRGFACGSNGGAPRQPLAGWQDFARCRAEPDGLHEVYFEYDDELEFIARAKDLEREITRWAGTTEKSFPVVVSALFDDAAVLRGIRMVTDSRPDHRNDITEANLRKRADAYLLGGMLAARFDIAPARDCTALPAAEGESAVGELFVKQSCEAADSGHGPRIILRINFFRKRGQSGVNPQLPTQLTEGQFESSARFEMYQK